MSFFVPHDDAAQRKGVVTLALAAGQINQVILENMSFLGDGAFINLPARQREMIQQALSGTLPPEYGAMIRQYFMNVASGKPAAGNSTEKK